MAPARNDRAARDVLRALSEQGQERAHRVLRDLDSREDVEYVAFILASLSPTLLETVDWDDLINQMFEAEVDGSLREEFGED